MKQYEIRDPVYGFVSFNDWEKNIIGHPVFQRLRRIKQLALTEMVYPGAVHTRFEHSLGVMHLATKMYDSIIEKDRGLLKDRLSYNQAGLKKDRQLIRLAALLHDVGHAPFSHTSEEIMPVNAKRGKPFKHEDYTISIIKNILKNIIEDHPINRTNYRIEAEEVAALIEGNPEVLGERLFWKVLISSQLDADRGDYLLRDSYHTGVKYGIYDHSRLINTLALGIEPESGEVVLGVDRDGWHVAEAVVIARYQLFTQVYFHKTRRAFDYHLKSAMGHILNGGKFPGPDLTSLEQFIGLDDYALWNRFRGKSDDPDCSAIMSRSHIREVYSTPEVPNQEDEAELQAKKRSLENAGIEYYEDRSEKLWYNLNNSKNGDKEIMIVSRRERSPRPLSYYSNIVKNIGDVKQIRIYVKPGDRLRAEEVLR
ncbi:MAG: deoxyguanosinetriphosphate triphosphohydrolase-like protein [Methanosaeta sp. PtaB.Bin039]|nr:MAG: deoxyguanosinetriphosphate triphosphohydrolase-like protein [Methanosaeta sp. PtaB.Bin039]HOT06260.1 HD domain-containing protein [Methanotrichaceae archaeon]HQF15701.1 HD domain-containing protein [Methanotrichaceae archaeon]HQI90626.1 HD domain-containing protein [Methanotrichaceae archaeon]